MKKYIIAFITAMFLTGVETAFATEKDSIKFKNMREIIEFQKAHGLVPDGIVGRKTRAAMRREEDSEDIKEAIADSCHVFFVFEVSCTADKANVDAMKDRLAPIPEPIKRGLQMVGMDARKDRTAIKNYIGADPKSIAWCAAWANSVLAETGYQTTDSMLARSFLHYGKIIREPRQGDLVILRRGRSKWAGHVGFYIQTVEINGVKYIAVLGGNQHKGVNVAYFPAKNVLGYREPVQG
jgi:uncharacterized protein (TIGR02594 family)